MRAGRPGLRTAIPPTNGHGPEIGGAAGLVAFFATVAVVVGPVVVVSAVVAAAVVVLVVVVVAPVVAGVVVVVALVSVVVVAVVVVVVVSVDAVVVMTSVVVSDVVAGSARIVVADRPATNSPARTATTPIRRIHRIIPQTFDSARGRAGQSAVCRTNHAQNDSSVLARRTHPRTNPYSTNQPIAATMKTRNTPLELPLIT